MNTQQANNNFRAAYEIQKHQDINAGYKLFNDDIETVIHSISLINRCFETALLRGIIENNTEISTPITNIRVSSLLFLLVNMKSDINENVLV